MEDMYVICVIATMVDTFEQCIFSQLDCKEYISRYIPPPTPEPIFKSELVSI